MAGGRPRRAHRGRASRHEKQQHTAKRERSVCEAEKILSSHAPPPRFCRTRSVRSASARTGRCDARGSGRARHSRSRATHCVASSAIGCVASGIGGTDRQSRASHALSQACWWYGWGTAVVGAGGRSCSVWESGRFISADLTFGFQGTCLIYMSGPIATVMGYQTVWARRTRSDSARCNRRVAESASSGRDAAPAAGAAGDVAAARHEVVTPPNRRMQALEEVGGGVRHCPGVPPRTGEDQSSSWARRDRAH